MLVGACGGEAVDVYVVNPCDHVIAIATYEVTPDLVAEEHKLFEGTVPPESVRLVKNAFSSDHQGSLRIDDAAPEEVDSNQFDSDEIAKQILVVPASRCRD